MPRLYTKSTNTYLGSIGDADLQVLTDQLEEEHRTDTDYFIDAPTIDLLEAAGASGAMVSLLRSAVGQGDGVDVRWEK